MLIAGVDEAGRGPLAGPLVVAAVILDPARPIDGLNDSKQLSQRARERLAPIIQSHALTYRIEWVGAAEIDRINVLEATLAGMARALAALGLRPGLALIDGNRLPRDLCCAARAIVGGDALEPAISAASILAKVARDRHMHTLDQSFPGYGFAKHKGYPTREHLAALARLGPCAEHRQSYAPVRKRLDQDWK